MNKATSTQALAARLRRACYVRMRKQPDAAARAYNRAWKDRHNLRKLAGRRYR